jgi:signal transduction histidine kinase/ligand-binding sensor domain-containing protein
LEDLGFHWTVLLLTLSCLTTVCAASGDFLVSNWRTEDGLPHSSINSLVQTRDGYLWVGTFVGVVRFDGARFTRYSSANLPQLGPGRVSKLFEDRSRVLWIGLESGRLLAWKDGVVRIHLQNSDPPNQAVIAMAQDKAGTIWLQTSSGHLGRLSSDGVDFVATTGALSHRPSLGLLVDSKGVLWVGTKDGLKVWNGEKLVTPPGMAETPNLPLEVFALAQNGALWTFRNKTLRKIREGRILIEAEAPVGFASAAVELLETTDGRLWLAAHDGGLFCRTPSGDWRPISAELGLQGGNRALCEDREGNLWRGGFGSGLARLRPKLFTTHELPAAQHDRYAMSVCADAADNVWAMFNSDALGRVEAGTQTLRFWQPPELPQSFRAVLDDHAGSLWMGTGDGRLYRRYDGRFICELQVCPTPDYVSALFKDSKSNLWVGFTGGAGVGFMPQSDPKRWRVVGGLSFPDVRCIAEAASGAMWFGTHYGGVFCWQDGGWKRFTSRDGLPSDYVRSLQADADGTIWLATIAGLCRWREGKFTAITTAHGLWHDSLSHIVDDGRGSLWLSSFGGVFRVARQQLNEFAEGRLASIQCIGYSRNDGLPAQECPGGFQPAGAKTADGRLWFPTVDGIISIAPQSVPENTLPPPVWIEEVTVDGDSTILHHTTSTVTIPPGKRRLDLRFTALSLASPEKVRFRHRLEGLDEDWSQPDDKRTVTYSYLPPGRYNFRVIACNNDGLWNTEGHSLGLTLQPFFWQTWWFQSGAALLLVVAVAFTVRGLERWKARLRLERLEQKHAVEHERNRISKDIHDDLGARLTQIVFLSQRVEEAIADPKEFKRWITMIPATARRTIQSLDEIVWAINPRHDSLESLANYLSQFASEHVTLAGIRCVLDVPTVVPPLELSAELRHNLVLAARESVQNAVTHAKATEVRVSLQLGDTGLIIAIVDDGGGFDLRRLGCDGNGLHNMQQRLADIGGQFDITSQPGCGTTVRLIVPRARLLGRVTDGKYRWPELNEDRQSKT